VGQYEHTHKGRRENAAELCRLANDRAGYEFGLRLALEALDIVPERIDYLVQRAKARDFKTFIPELARLTESK